MFKWLTPALGFAVFLALAFVGSIVLLCAPSSASAAGALDINEIDVKQEHINACT